MAESFVQAPPNSSGIKLHTFQRTIGANNVDDEIVIQGIPYLATYATSPSAVSVATGSSHLLQLMAGASLNVYVVRIRIMQFVVGTASAQAIQVIRLTTAGTGGTAVTPLPYDSSDAASGATSMTLPTVKGTEAANPMDRIVVPCYAAHPIIYQWEWVAQENSKFIRIPAGTANGIAFKNTTSDAAATYGILVEFFEANF